QVSSEYNASCVNTNPVVVRRQMSLLKKAGMNHSMRGAKKNTLLKKPEEITLYVIYTAVELEREIYNIHQNPNPNCSV
ncbi:Rrf2 family transcriptional regulator, partial [Enterococcus faecalis]|uniref:Rrf2 family transcriptional regulator n=1 Tax=Enterococcus faecalis TaxID=1351 RepID=UPI003D6C0643